MHRFRFIFESFRRDLIIQSLKSGDSAYGGFKLRPPADDEVDDVTERHQSNETCTGESGRTRTYLGGECNDQNGETGHDALKNEEEPALNHGEKIRGFLGSIKQLERITYAIIHPTERANRC